ncbi:MAG TPA: T9SS type A sorting domain-containing protein [Bacteroidales bacterium]|nr:T9SS type A sorting domain-containing protein [Bacteroidales bacterium]HNS46112.1 T9SS type A sorting domain-containing protein [Bacteroidales bacterium]
MVTKYSGIGIILTGLFLGIPLLNDAQLPPGWEYTTTSTFHIIAIPLGADPNVDGEPLSPGDYVGVFFSDNETLKCGGASVWNGTSNIPVSAWGEDAYMAGKQGFTEGEPITWKVFRQSDSQEYEAEATYQTGCSGCTNWDGLWHSFGLSALEFLEGEDYDLVLENITIADNEAFCYDAIHSIFVAGNATSVIVENGGELALVAGNNIKLRTGFHAQPGSYLHAFIDDEGCSEPLKPATIFTAGNDQLNHFDFQTDKMTGLDGRTAEHEYVHIYPNSVFGQLIVEISSADAGELNRIILYDFHGRGVFLKEGIGTGKTVLDLAAYPSGMYLVRVVNSGRSETVRVVHQFGEGK